MNKIVLSAQDLLEDSFRLGLRVLEDGFKPTMIIAIWRGGTPVGMAVQEIMAYCGVESDHIAIRTSSYVGVDQRGAVAVHGLNYIIKKICHDDRVLIVDDVFDTGNTIKAVIEELGNRARDNTPEDIRIAVPWYKPERNETDLTPDYFIRETAEWLVFPHELDALEPDELRRERPEIAAIIEAAKSDAHAGRLDHPAASATADSTNSASGCAVSSQLSTRSPATSAVRPASPDVVALAVRTKRSFVIGSVLAENSMSRS